MSKDPHFLALESMYLATPSNSFYNPTIVVSDSKATIEIEATDQLFRSAEAVVYDSQGVEVGRGSGVFVRGKLPLSEAAGYSPE